MISSATNSSSCSFAWKPATSRMRYVSAMLAATISTERTLELFWNDLRFISAINVLGLPGAVVPVALHDGKPIGDGTQKEARMIYLFPILPSLTYNFKF